MEVMNKVELGLSKAEEYLSKSAAVPALGTVPAIVKIALGTIQGAVAITCLAISYAPVARTQHISLRKRALEHLAHCIMNIVAGILEGIPLLGTHMYVNKMLHKNAKNHEPLYASNGNDFNIPYNALIKVEICGTDNDLVQKAQQMFQKEISGNTFTNLYQYIVAQHVVRKILSNLHMPQSCSTTREMQISCLEPKIQR